jgi:hypothetical protein
MRSPSQSGYNSRRTSWGSESTGSRDSRVGPFASPFDDSRAPSRAGSDDEGVNTQTVSEKYNILPSAGLLLFPEDVEKDDYLHNPDPTEKEGRITCSDLFSKRGITNLGGLILITLGVFMLFIGYPIITFAVKKTEPKVNLCASDPMCIRSDVPLLKNVRTGLIDPATPSSVMTRKSVNGKTLNLVFSDEFETDGRTFYDGDDPYFQGVDIWYGVTQDLEVSATTYACLSQKLTVISGTTPTLSLPRMVFLRSPSTLSRTTASTTAPVCCNRGTSFASRAVTLRLVSRFLVEATRSVSGLVSGLWVILADLDIVPRPMALGPTVTRMSATLVSLLISHLPMV